MLSDVASLFAVEPVLAPLPSDRRASRRFIDCWARLAQGRFPDWASLKAVDLGEDWNWMFTVDLARSTGFPYFIYLGPKLGKLSDVYLAGDAEWTLSLLDKATTEINAAVASRAPQQREDTLILCNGRRVLFRSATAPLADDGEAITHVAGIVSGTLAE